MARYHGNWGQNGFNCVTLARNAGAAGGGLTMAPKNGMMAKLEAKYNTYYENLFRARINMLTQICQDAACFAANDVFKM